MAALRRELGNVTADAQNVRSPLGDADAPLQPRIDSDIANHLGYAEQSLDGVRDLVGKEFSALTFK